MKKLISNKKICAASFSIAVFLLFVYVGAQFTKEDKPKDQPKEFLFHLVKRRILL
jgi:CHASE3 domain sensor protein